MARYCVAGNFARAGGARDKRPSRGFMSAGAILYVFYLRLQLHTPAPVASANRAKVLYAGQMPHFLRLK